MSECNCAKDFVWKFGLGSLGLLNKKIASVVLDYQKPLILTIFLRCTPLPMTAPTRTYLSSFNYTSPICCC